MRTTEGTLLDVIARAAAPCERASLPCFEPPSHPGASHPVAVREAEWVRLLTGGDRHAFVKLLATRDITLDEARRGLADVEVTDVAVLPAWARDVLLLFSPDAMPPDDSDEPIPPFVLGELTDGQALTLMAADPSAPWPLHRAFEPLVRRGAAHLRDVAARSRAPVAATARRQLLASLTQRVSGPCTTLLYHRLTLADVVGDHPGSVGQTVQAAFFGDDSPALDQWWRLLRCYPALARLIAVAYRNWCDVTAELIGRLDRDRHRLEAAFAAPGLGALAECMLCMGDSHDHGRTVAMLRFAGGARVVYKPKDLRVAAAYMRLLAWLDAAGLDPALPTRHIVQGDGYAWEEFVSDRECASLDDVRRFYMRIGMHARLVQLLDGVDFTGDNVIAAGDAPELVDLETLLTPRIPMPEPSPGYDDALARAFESPARGCLVTAKVLGERGRPAAELGALAASAECIAPFKQRTVRRTDAGPALVDIYPEFPTFRAAPSWNGMRVQSTAYFDDVVAGYVAMGEHLRRVHDRLAAADGPLTDMQDVVVRCLCRDTHVYARMLQSSLTPARLRDGVQRELCLERLWKARFPSTAVVPAEIACLRDGDIPMFTSIAGTRQLLHERAVIAERFFTGTAWERLMERVRSLPETTRERDRELIESVLFTVDPRIRRGVAAVAPARRGVADWTAAAECVGREIVDVMIPTASEPKWVGGSHRPWSGCWSFSVLGDDLYSGAAGIGLVLADLAAATGTAAFEHAARGALRGVSRRLARAHTQASADPVGHPPGAIFGWSGGLYACERGGRLVADEDSGAAAAELWHALARDGEEGVSELLARSDACDVATGAAGLLLVALAVASGTDREREIVASAAARYVTANLPSDERENPLYPPDAQPRGIVSEAVGARLALARLNARAARATPVASAEDSLVHLRSSADLTALLSLAGSDGVTCQAALRASEAHLAELPRDTDGLAWLERGELALAAYAATNGGDYLAIACDSGERLWDLKEHTRRWLPECLLADRYNLSAFVGLGAIAHFFLRLAHPGRTPSYRILE